MWLGRWQAPVCARRAEQRDMLRRADAAGFQSLGKKGGARLARKSDKPRRHPVCSFYSSSLVDPDQVILGSDTVDHNLQVRSSGFHV